MDQWYMSNMSGCYFINRLWTCFFATSAACGDNGFYRLDLVVTIMNCLKHWKGRWHMMGSCEIRLVWRLHATNGMGWTMGTASYQKIGWGVSSGVDIWNVDTIAISEHFALLSFLSKIQIDSGRTRSWWVFQRRQLGVGRIRVELAFWQELVLMFASAGNICSLAFGATVSFFSPFVRPSTVSFIHPHIDCSNLHLFETRISLHTWLPLRDWKHQRRPSAARGIPTISSSMSAEAHDG